MKKLLKNPREAAFLSLVDTRNGRYIENFFKEEELDLSTKDLKLAKEIAYGSMKRLLSLEYLLKQLASKNKNSIDKLKLKKKEKFLCYSAIYQYFFMDKIPLFALVNETVEIAKKYFGSSKAKFINHILRLLDKTDLSLPTTKSIKDLSVFYSFPEFFIKKLIDEYGIDSSIDILKSSNQNNIPMVRIREDGEGENYKIIHDGRFKVAEITNKDIAEFCGKKQYYIQNITPALLLEKLLEEKHFVNILDMCACPGGKAIALYDLFPSCNLSVNDVSEDRLETLKENLETYSIKPTIYNFSAEDFNSDNRFDLIVLDVPCSNSGVLGKRQEARWRIAEENTEQLETLQLDILKSSIKLLSDDGYILYMTCSILKNENEEIIERALDDMGLILVKSYKVLPDISGKDGGYGALLKIK